MRVTSINRVPDAVGRVAWQAEGACRDGDVERFFHIDGERGPRYREREDAAKAVCADCAVLQHCRDYALNAHEPYGVWGGLSESDRARLLADERQTATKGRRHGLTPIAGPTPNCDG